MTNTTTARLKVFASSDGPIIEDEGGLMPVPSSTFFSQPNAVLERKTKVILGHIVTFLQLRDRETKQPYREIISGHLVDDRGETFDRMEFIIDKQGRYRLDLSKGHTNSVQGLGSDVVVWTLAQRITLGKMDYVLVSSHNEVLELESAFAFDRGNLICVDNATNRGKIKSSIDPADTLLLERYHYGAKEGKPEIWGIKFRRKNGKSFGKLAEALGDKPDYHKDELRLSWTDFSDQSTWRMHGIDFGRRNQRRKAVETADDGSKLLGGLETSSS